MLADHYTFNVSTSEIIAAAGIVLTILGGMWLLFRWLISTTIDYRLEESVTEAVNRRMQIIDTKLDGISLNVRETSEAVGKVHDLEVTINNGLSAKVAEIDRKVDLLTTHFLLDS